jgi:hypothetical protein
VVYQLIKLDIKFQRQLRTKLDILTE